MYLSKNTYRKELNVSGKNISMKLQFTYFDVLGDR